MSEELPEGWATAKPLDIASLVRGVSYEKGEAKSAPASDHILLLRANNITDAGLVFTDLQYVPKHRVSEVQMLRRGDIVLAMSSGSKSVVGKAASVESECVATFGAFCGAVRPATPLDAAYVGMFFQTRKYRSVISELAAGTNINNLKREYFEELDIPVAPLPEQRRIVAKAECLLEQVNLAKARLDRVRGILKRFRQAVLAAACSGELTRTWRAARSCSETAQQLQERIWEARRKRVAEGGVMRPKTGTTSERPLDSDIESFELPDTWRWACWDDLCDWITYGFTRPMPHVECGIPIVTARHVTGSQIDFSSVDFTPRHAFDELSDKDRPRRGEMLITKDGTIGRAAIVESDTPFCINQSVMVLRFGGLSANPRYLLRAIESPWTQDLIDEGAKGSAIRHIAITAFGRFPVPLPPLDEQVEIAERVERLFGIANAIERRVANTASRVEKLPQAILAKAFSGQLVPTEAELARAEGRDYETAEALLAKVMNGQRASQSDESQGNTSRRRATKRGG